MQPLGRVTQPTREVLIALLDSNEPTWGLRLIARTGRPAGTVYPLLDRLERSGWVVSQWDEDSTRPGPRRRLYLLTPEGRIAAAELVAKDRAPAPAPAAPARTRMRRPGEAVS